MATIIDKLLNRRDSEPKPTPEELRQVAELAQEESTRLAELIDRAQRELRSEAAIRGSLQAVEGRLEAADGSLRA